ncbi:hypothetical protein EDB81DRAFT_171648 [Dactylonectria macrodidyma]|uniref:Uncharacterized protein n=1 Tax=Dactylonectria macrodidyma TaxID=307937 RepID=A0A9P9FNG5_9HYPO|nr:hypothetical protein EDB81DRAFT_171648 [Dactylonectria macrodidyma]
MHRRMCWISHRHNHPGIKTSYRSISPPSRPNVIARSYRWIRGALQDSLRQSAVVSTDAKPIAVLLSSLGQRCGSKRMPPSTSSRNVPSSFFFLPLFALSLLFVHGGRGGKSLNLQRRRRRTTGALYLLFLCPRAGSWRVHSTEDHFSTAGFIFSHQSERSQSWCQFRQSRSLQWLGSPCVTLSLCSLRGTISFSDGNGDTDRPWVRT